jgi:hypothetical protein
VVVATPVAGGLVAGPAGARARWATTVEEPARRPRRVATPKSRRRRRRCGAGSTSGVRGLKRRAVSGPCAGGPPGSPARHECACADGNRASCVGAGCSAGRCACSRRAPKSLSSSGCDRPVQRWLGGPGGEQTTPVGASPTSLRYGCLRRGSNRPARPVPCSTSNSALPVEDCLLAGVGCGYVSCPVLSGIVSGPDSDGTSAAGCVEGRRHAEPNGVRL